VLLFGTAPVAGQGNNAEIRVGESFVPGSVAAGETAGVRVKVFNNGGTTWREGTLHRLGAEGSNQVTWSGWACGGYALSPTDARVFLCNDVLPGGSYEFVFNVTVPAGASGSVRLGVRMVQDAVEWFGQSYTWNIQVASPPACPNSPLATPDDRWKLEIWGNRDLAGGTVEQRYDAPGSAGFRFDWGGGGPSACAGGDNFGVRFSRRAYFSKSATYEFTTTTDDGVRLWVDGNLLIDQWVDQAPTSHRARFALSAGWHDLRMDYYENGGGAFAELAWVEVGTSGNNAEIRVGESSVPGSLPAGETAGVRVKVYNNGGTTWPAGTLHRLGAEGSNQVLWGGWGPCGGYANGPTDARIFLCNDVLPGGSYEFVFNVTVPAGVSGSVGLAVRMVQDGVEWFGQSYTWNITVTGGPRCPRDAIGLADDRWRLEIWDNRDFSGDAVERRHEPPSSAGFVFPWGGGGPSACVGGDNFAVRFSRRAQFPQSTNYRFSTRTDDGVRLRVDGVLLIDRWFDQGATTYTASLRLSAGFHTIEMDYYENAGEAYAELGWSEDAPPPPGGESPYLYGLHDHDNDPQEYLNRITNQGATGWVTATIAIGSNPNDTGGDDFTGLTNQGHTVIVRLNNGYCPDGTIPPRSKYSDFATRAANYVAATRGASIFVIGNETNLANEWPVVNGRLQYVSPQDYAELFRLSYNAIKARRPDAKVISQALAPFAGPYGGGQTCGYEHDPNPLNWVQYMSQMLTAIKSTGGIDGIALHINSRGYTYADIHSTEKRSAGGQMLYWSFYVYKDWVDLGIPRDLYHLPLYATESNGVYYWSGGHPENPGSHYIRGWMQEIYAEIDRYNQSAAGSGKPTFRCVNMYRWCCDEWNIKNSPYKGDILTDLDEAVSRKYRWPGGNRVLQVNAGSTTSASAAIDPAQAEARFTTRWPGSDVVMTLVSPSGRVIDRSTVALDVTHRAGPTSEEYVVAHPEPGVWGVALFGADVPPAGEPVDFSFSSTPEPPTDNTPPLITPRVEGAAGANGWYVSDVSVRWEVRDPESGIVASSGCESQAVSGDTAGLVLTCSATNGSGLPNSGSITLKLDKTPPVISASRSPGPNPAGWNNTDVTVRFECQDAVSGVAAPPQNPQVVSSEGAFLSLDATCADLAGNTAKASVSGISIDKTPPVLAFESPRAVLYSSSAAIPLIWSASDALSGVLNDSASLDGTAATNGQWMDLSTLGVGAHVVEASATDLAGNTATSSLSFDVLADEPVPPYFDWPLGACAGGELALGYGVEVAASQPSGGVDLRFASGTTAGSPVYSAGDGYVQCTSVDGDEQGSSVVVTHRLPGGRMVYTEYGQLGEVSVTRGQMVRRGEPIGVVLDQDGTGQTQLHFNVRHLADCGEPGDASPDGMDPIAFYYRHRPRYPATVVTAPRELPLYAGPSAKSRRIGSILPSTRLTALEVARGPSCWQDSDCSEWWYGVRYRGKHGFVMGFSGQGGGLLGIGEPRRVGREWRSPSSRPLVEYLFDQEDFSQGIQNSGRFDGLDAQARGGVEPAEGVGGQGNAIRLDGETGYVEVEGSESVALGGRLRMEAFIWRESDDGEDAIASQWYGGDRWLLTLYPEGNGRLIFTVRLSNGDYASVDYLLPDCDYLKRWVHVAATYDPAYGLRLYWNGTQVARNETVSDGLAPAGPLLHIGDAGNGWSRFHGRIDQVRIWASPSASREE
jgi:murein DD-endopeptidase MepM/ murein hydrolase activator NlpD